MANITNIKVILAAIDKVEIIGAHSTTEQHAGTKINGWFRPTGRNEIETVFAKASGRFGEIEFSVTKTETVKYRHDDDENVVSETSIGTGYIAYSAGVLDLDQAQALLTQAGFKFCNQKEIVIHDTLNTMNALLNQQGDVLTNGVGKIIESATHYSFERDDSVVLSGPLGNLWVYQDGTTYPASTVPGTNGYPAYSMTTHLERAKEAVRIILAKS